jgi:hypothetical protein
MDTLYLAKIKYLFIYINMTENNKIIFIKVKKQIANMNKTLNKVEDTIKLVSLKKEKAEKAVKELLKKTPVKKTPVKKVLTAEQKEENKKKRLSSIIKKNAIPDKKALALSAVSIFSNAKVPISLVRTEKQKTQIKLTAAQRYNLLTPEEKKDEIDRKKSLAVASTQRRKEARIKCLNETPEQKEKREAKEARRKAKVIAGFFKGV